MDKFFVSIGVDYFMFLFLAVQSFLACPQDVTRYDTTVPLDLLRFGLISLSGHLNGPISLKRRTLERPSHGIRKKMDNKRHKKHVSSTSYSILMSYFI